MARIVHRLRKLLGDRSGNILIELAVAMPLLTTIALGGIEVSRLVLINQKLDRVAASTSDLVAQAETISATGALERWSPWRLARKRYGGACEREHSNQDLWDHASR